MKSRRLLPAVVLALLLAPLSANVHAAGGANAARAMSMMWEMMLWFFANAANSGSFPGGWNGMNNWGGPAAGWGSAASGLGPWSQWGGAPWGGNGWNSGPGGFGGPWESFGPAYGNGGHTGARLDGSWQSGSGEVLLIDNGRFMLTSSGRTIGGLLERRGDRLLAYSPGSNASQEYRFLEGNGLLVLVDPYGRSISFRRLR